MNTTAWSQFTKGHNSIKPVEGVMVALLPLSDNALYFVPGFMKISKKVSEILSKHNLHTEIYKGA